MTSAPGSSASSDSALPVYPHRHRALPREALVDYFAAHPAAGYKIALNLAVVIGHRLHLFQTMWLRQVQRSVEVRSA